MRNNVLVKSLENKNVKHNAAIVADHRRNVFFNIPWDTFRRLSFSEFFMFEIRN